MAPTLRLAVVLALAVCAAASAARPKPHVTLITDSVGGSLGWDGTAARIFEQGLDANLQLEACRRLTTPGCISPPPESALATIRRLGRRIGPNVVIDVGYNDYPTVFAPGIREVLRALHADGVEHIFWVTLRAASIQYRESNAAIWTAARRDHDVTVIDWNACAAGHPEWFGDDGVHLTGEGAQGLARCIHDGVLRVLNAPQPPAIEIELTFSRGITPGFRARLEASGGKAPYRFAVRGLPRGLHATKSGTIAGAAPAHGFVLDVRARDAAGRVATAAIRVAVTS